MQGGRSYYARVVRFLKIDEDDSPGFASVRWFSKPTYPHNSPLVVCVRDDGDEVDFEFTSIIPLTSIEPSRVMVRMVVVVMVVVMAVVIVVIMVVLVLR